MPTILKSLQAEPITITKIGPFAFGLLLSCANLVHAQTPSPTPTQTLPPTCTSDASKASLQNLVSYLNKPTKGAVQPLAKSFCKVFSDPALESCKVSLNDELLAKLESAGQNDEDVVLLLKCFGSASDLASMRDVNELQARLLDKYKANFLKKWNSVNAPHAQKPEDFIGFVPEVSLDLKKRNQIYEARLALINKAPVKVKDDFKKAAAILKENISNNKSLLGKNSDGKSDDSEVTFKTSQFREMLSKRLNGSFDVKNATARANEILLDEGLNFRAHPKSETRTWKVCSASTSAAQEGSCHTVTVGFEKVTDSCGTDALLGLVFQAGDTWVLMSGSSTYRVDIGDLLSPKAITLTKENATYHTWNFPDGFTPEFISSDLHAIYAKTSIYSEDGKKLGNLHLVLRDNGRFQFVEIPKEEAAFIHISGKTDQKVKSLDGSSAELHLPPLTCGN